MKDRHMKKKIISILLVTSLLVGCGKSIDMTLVDIEKLHNHDDEDGYVYIHGEEFSDFLSADNSLYDFPKYSGEWSFQDMSVEAQDLLLRMYDEESFKNLFFDEVRKYEPFFITKDKVDFDRNSAIMFNVYTIAKSIGWRPISLDTDEMGFIVNDNKDALIHWKTEEEFWKWFGFKDYELEGLEANYQDPTYIRKYLSYRVSDEDWWDHGEMWPDGFDKDADSFVGLGNGEVDHVSGTYVVLGDDLPVYVILIPNADEIWWENYKVRLILGENEDKSFEYEDMKNYYIDACVDFYALARECGDDTLMYFKNSNMVTYKDIPGVVINLDKAILDDKIVACNYIRSNINFDWKSLLDKHEYKYDLSAFDSSYNEEMFYKFYERWNELELEFFGQSYIDYKDSLIPEIDWED